MISIIVPVYKVEKYIDKCVNSILNQTFRNFELILVDDGSPDNCPQICDKYAKIDSRIKVIHKKNGGLSDARNVGISNAKGNYVTFIDSDDYVSPFYLSTLWSLIEKYEADIAVGGIYTFYEGDNIKDKSNSKEYCFTGKEALENMFYQKTMDTSACAILLPIDIARQNSFPKGKYHEDEFTTYKYYDKVKRVAVTTRKLYFYLQRAGSIMHTFGQASRDELDAADNLVDFCENNYPDLVKAAMSKKFSDYCQVLLSVENNKIDKDVYLRIISYLKRNCGMIIFNKDTRVKNKMAAILLCVGPRLLYLVNKIKSK